jgi:transposase
VDRIRRKLVREPEEIADAEHEQIVERVCAIDVAKEAGKVCRRLSHESVPGRRVSKVWDVKATTNAVIELGDYLVGQGIEKVTVESTSDYWRIWFYLLEARGLDVQLVNAREVKNVPGRPMTDLLTELRRGPRGSGRQALVGVSRFSGRDWRRGRAAGSVPVGCCSAWVAGAHRGSVRAVSAG